MSGEYGTVPASHGTFVEFCAHCNAQVDVGRNVWAQGKRWYCRDHDQLAERDPQFIVPEALRAARLQLAEHSSTFVRWTLPPLHDMLGFLMRGTVTYGCALPSNGKTSFIGQQITDWDAQGLRPWIMPTESRPKGLMVRIICRRLGIPADDALSGRLRERMDAGDLQAAEDHKALERAYRTMEESAYERDATLAIEPAPHLTRTTFRESLMAAKQWEAGIVVVDHCDHIRGDQTTGHGYQASEAIQHDALEFANLFDLPVLMMSQLNRSKTENDVLAIYRPPLVSWIWMPGPKEQNATTIFGLFRPMRRDVDEGLVKDIRAGRAQNYGKQISIPHCMGVLDMKSRYAGETRDRVTYLEYVRGTLGTLPDAVRREIEGDQHGIRLSHPY